MSNIQKSELKIILFTSRPEHHGHGLQIKLPEVPDEKNLGHPENRPNLADPNHSLENHCRQYFWNPSCYYYYYTSTQCQRRGDLFGEALSKPQLLLSFRFLHSFEDAIQDWVENTGKERSALLQLKSWEKVESPFPQVADHMVPQESSKLRHLATLLLLNLSYLATYLPLTWQLIFFSTQTDS